MCFCYDISLNSARTCNFSEKVVEKTKTHVLYFLILTSLCLLMTVCCPGWIGNPTRTIDSHLKRIISTNCCIHTVVPPDDGPRYARNMWRLTKYAKNKLCIKLAFLLTLFVPMCSILKQSTIVFRLTHL